MGKTHSYSVFFGGIGLIIICSLEEIQLTDMNKLIEVWKASYFTDPLLTIVLIILLIIALKKRKNYPQFKLFPIYFALFIILKLEQFIYFPFFYRGVHPAFYVRLYNYFDCLVTLSEFFVFMYFFYSILNGSKLKKIIIALTTVGLIIFFFIIFHDLFSYQKLEYVSLNNIYIIELLILLLSCSFYYIELFRSNPVLKLTNTPDFWVAGGLTFYLACTLPITIIIPYIFKTNSLLYLNLYSIIYLFYILLFLMTIRAYLCKPEKTI